MQAMAASHVALVSLNMGIDLFSNYRSDTPMQLGKEWADGRNLNYNTIESDEAR